MVASTPIKISLTAIALGVVHVLTGPDHVSAIATMSANVSNTWEAFWLGIRWGVGHSTGLIVIAIVFLSISFSETDDDESTDDEDVIEIPESVSNFFESLVGIFMLLLGIYGVRRAFNKHSKRYLHGHVHQLNDSTSNASPDGIFRHSHSHTSEPRMAISGPEIQNISSQQDPQVPAELNEHQQQDSNNQPKDLHLPAELEEQQHEDSSNQHTSETTITNNSEDTTDSTGVLSSSSSRRCCSCFDRITASIPTRVMAFVAGIFHGLAGPGGVLGVIPAVQLHNVRLATLYLSLFCLSSTLMMGVFAVLYGTCTARLARGSSSQLPNDQEQALDEEGDAVVRDNDKEPSMSETPDIPDLKNSREFWIEALSACLSIIVGITWLILLSVGKLDSVFG